MTTKEELEALFLNSEKFYIAVDDLVWKEDISYIESVMLTCDDKGIDPEDLIKLKLISPILKLKLEEEGIDLGYLKAPTSIALC